MFNENLLRAALAEIGMKMSDLADLMGISLSALYNKVNGNSEFTRSEIQTAAEFFGWNKANAIFFGMKKGGKQ